MASPNPHSLTDLRVAVAFFTRLPVGVPEGDLSRACWAFPVAGLVVGGVGGLIYAAAAALDLPVLVAGLLAVAAMAVFTGALHEDGLADTADGFGGGATPERKLEIMRDSRNGAFGLLALVFSVFLRVAALAAIADPMAATAAMLVAATVSRGMLPAVMRLLPLARPDGVAALAGQPQTGRAAIAVLLSVAAAYLLLGIETATAALLLCGIVATIAAWLARRQVGGYNGDILGAIQQLTEIAVLITVSAG